MERTAYTLLQNMESSWWYRGRTWAVRAVAKASGIATLQTALDYGAGYGGMCETLHSLANSVDAFEPDSTAHQAATKRRYRNAFADESAAFSEKYDLIGLFDVLEHIKDDAAFLARAHGALAPSGKLIITVPAFQALWSAHDVEHHHHRRYTARSLSRLLQDAGYCVDYVGYWNCVLIIPAALLRLCGRSGEGGLTPPFVVNALLLSIVRLEAFLLRFIPLPWGLSVIAVASKGEKKTGS